MTAPVRRHFDGDPINVRTSAGRRERTMRRATGSIDAYKDGEGAHRQADPEMDGEEQDENRWKDG